MFFERLHTDMPNMVHSLHNITQDGSKTVHKCNSTGQNLSSNSDITALDTWPFLLNLLFHGNSDNPKCVYQMYFFFCQCWLYLQSTGEAFYQSCLSLHSVQAEIFSLFYLQEKNTINMKKKTLQKKYYFFTPVF